MGIDFIENQCYKSSVLLNAGIAVRNMAKDPETGFLVLEDAIPTYNVNGVSSSLVFRPPQKLEFLAKLAETWPNDAAALAHVSISWKCYRYHLEADPEFKECVNQINSNGVGIIKGHMFRFASEKVAGFMDRVALGRIYARDEFDPGARVEVTHKQEDRADMKKRWDRLHSVIDAEVVKAVTLARGPGSLAPGSSDQDKASMVQEKPTP